MGGFRSLRACVTTCMLALLGLGWALLASPTASAGGKNQSTVVPESSSAAPMVLASTGFDITVPIIIGLSVLLLGTVMVGWAFLATGRRSPR